MNRVGIFAHGQADRDMRCTTPGVDFSIECGSENVRLVLSVCYKACTGHNTCTKIDVLGVYIDGKLNFNGIVRRICSKASAQISALQRLAGLVGYTSRQAIYTSFISSNFNYCPLMWFFTSRKSIKKIDKIQERALRFILKDHTRNY